MPWAGSQAHAHLGSDLWPRGELNSDWFGNEFPEKSKGFA